MKLLYCSCCCRLHCNNDYNNNNVIIIVMQEEEEEEEESNAAGVQCRRAVRATGEMQYVEGVSVFVLGGHVHLVCR